MALNTNITNARNVWCLYIATCLLLNCGHSVNARQSGSSDRAEQSGNNAASHNLDSSDADSRVLHRAQFEFLGMKKESGSGHSARDPKDPFDSERHDSWPARQRAEDVIPVRQSSGKSDDMQTVSRSPPVVDTRTKLDAGASNSCHCKAPDREQVCKGAGGRDVIFMRRVVSSLRHHINEVSSTDVYTMSLTLTSEDLGVLERFSQPDSNIVQEVSDVLVNGINHVVPSQPTPSPVVHWISQHQSTIASVLQILLIIVLVVVILLVTVKLWWGLGARRFLIFMTVVAFCISVPWTWVHLYKQNLAERTRRADRLSPPECDVSTMSWRQILWHSDSKCSQFYQDQMIDPLWEVKPTTAIAITVVEFVWKPLEIMGGPVGKFVRDCLEPLPFYLKPVVAILGLMFLWWCLVLISGMRVWTWFFTVEPAVTAQYQLTAMETTVGEMRQFIQNANDTHEQRAAEVQGVLQRLSEQVDRQDDMGEMMPVLQSMAADYAQQQNTAKALPERGAGDAPPFHATGAGRGAQATEPNRYAQATSSRHGAGDSIASPSSEFSLLRPDHIVLTTSYVEDIVQFYRRIGMELRSFSSGRKALHFGQAKINIHEVGAENQPRAAKPASGCLDICLVCNCNVEATLSHLKVENVVIELGPVSRTGALGPITSIYVRDPDQNLIELAHYADHTPGETTTIHTVTAGETTSTHTSTSDKKINIIQTVISSP